MTKGGDFLSFTALPFVSRAFARIPAVWRYGIGVILPRRGKAAPNPLHGPQTVQGLIPSQ